MSLRGSLSTMSAEDVLEWMARRKISAPVTFERRDLVRSLVIEEGQIVWASSNRRDEQLGVILVKSGLVAERALADALAAAAELPVPNEAGRAAAAEHDVRRQAERVEAILAAAARGRPA